MISDMDFDADGFHYFVDAGTIAAAAEGYDFVCSACVSKGDVENGKRIIYVTFRDGYLGDFASEDVADELDKGLMKIKGVAEVNWEDREFFSISYGEGQKIEDIVRRVDKKVAELAKARG